MTARVKPGYNKQATLPATDLIKKKDTVFNVSASVLKDNFMLTETERKKSYLKFLFDATVTGFRYETLQFRIKMRFCYGYTNECQNDLMPHDLSTRTTVIIL
jgi:hypothetical protein